MLFSHIKYSLLLIIALFITGCGGGASDSEQNLSLGKVGGLWVGTYRSLTSGYVSNITGIVTEQGEVFWVYKTGGTITQVTEGRIFLNGDIIQNVGLGLTGHLNSQTTNGQTYADGTTTISTDITGTLKEKSKLTLQEIHNNTTTGVYSLQYDPYYDNNSNLAQLAGSYSTTINGITTVHNISNQGHLTGGNSLNCQYDGQISILDDFYNLYRVHLTTTNCDQLNGSWSGYLTLSGNNSQLNNKITLFTKSSQFVQAYTLDRQ